VVLEGAMSNDKGQKISYALRKPRALEGLRETDIFWREGRRGGGCCGRYKFDCRAKNELATWSELPWETPATNPFSTPKPSPTITTRCRFVFCTIPIGFRRECPSVSLRWFIYLRTQIQCLFGVCPHVASVLYYILRRVLKQPAIYTLSVRLVSHHRPESVKLDGYG